MSAESFLGGRPYLWELSKPDDYFIFYHKKLEKLRTYLEGHSVTLVAYFRQQNKWLESAIPQIIRYEGTMGQRIYENDKQLIDLLSPRMDYNRLIGTWDNVVSPDHMRLREYNRDNFPENNVIVDFLRQIGVSDERLSAIDCSDNVHDSWSREFIEIKKRLNIQQKSRIQEDAIIEVITRLNKEYGSQKKYQLPQDVHNAVLGRFKESNKALSDNYNDGSLLFSEHPKIESSGVYTPPSSKEIAEAMSMFEQYYKSWRGRRVFILSVFKRFLKKLSPFLYSMCALQWKKMKGV